MTKLRHYDNLGTARFVTFSCHKKLQLLIDDHDRITFLKCLSNIQSKYSLKLYGYVLMPDHVHLVLLPPDSVKIGTVIGEIKSQSARAILSDWGSRKDTRLQWLGVQRNGASRLAFWERRCYDHNCRSIATVLVKINYCHNNPVARGLVSEPGEWRWSSYKWYVGKQNDIVEIEQLEI